MNDEDPVYAVIVAHSFNVDALKPYLAGLASAYAPFAGRYSDVSKKRGSVYIEGEQFQSVQIVRWQSRSDFNEFWKSDSYQSIKPLRDEVGKFSISLVPAELGQ